MKYKEGFIREDGKFFWRDSKLKGEIWLTEEQFKKRVATRTEYRKRCAELYKKMRDEKNVMDRPFFGKYSFAKNKYFIGMTSSGKENWVSKEKFERFKVKQENCKKRYIEKLRKLPKTNLKFGDPHPENPDLFVTLLIGNKPFFGNAEKLQEVIEKRNRFQKNKVIKNQIIRRDKLNKLDKKHRLRRGHIDDITGNIFWEYDVKGDPKFLPPDVFHEKRNKANEKRKRNRDIKKTLKSIANVVESTTAL